MTWRWTGVNKRHSDASQQTIRLRSRMKVLLIRRKNQRVSVSYVRVLFVVSQENSVFTLCLFKYGGFFMSTYLEHRNTPTLCRAGARYFYLIHIYRESVHFIFKVFFKFSKDSVRVSLLIRGHCCCNIGLALCYYLLFKELLGHFRSNETQSIYKAHHFFLHLLTG